MQTKRALLKSLTRAVRVVTGAAARAVARMEKKAAVYFSKSWLEKMEPWLWRFSRPTLEKLLQHEEKRISDASRATAAERRRTEALRLAAKHFGDRDWQWRYWCLRLRRTGALQDGGPLLFLNFGGHCRRSVWRGQRMRQRRGVVLRPLLSLICRRLLTAAQDCRSVRCASRCRAIPQGPQMMKRCCACFGSGWVMWPMTKRSPSPAKKP